MSWIFTLAIALIILAVFCIGSGFGMASDSGGAGEVLAAYFCGVVLLVVGLLTFQSSVMNEVNCYRDGGQVIDTQCMVVKGAVNGND